MERPTLEDIVVSRSEDGDICVVSFSGWEFSV